MARLATVCHGYRAFPAGRMTGEMLLGLEANLPRLKAREELEHARRNNVRLSADRTFDLVLLATGDRAQAEAAFSAVRHAELRAGITPI